MIPTTRIMLIEDEADIRETVAALLRFEGLDVIEAANGKEALDLLKPDKLPVLCVCDINMPVMNGPDFIRHALLQYPYLSVVMLTAYSEKERIIEALRLGAIDYLVKPFVPEDLVLNLYTLIEIAKQRSQIALSQDLARRQAAEKLTVLHRIKNSLKKTA